MNGGLVQRRSSRGMEVREIKGGLNDIALCKVLTTALI